MYIYIYIYICILKPFQAFQIPDTPMILTCNIQVLPFFLCLSSICQSLWKSHWGLGWGHAVVTGQAHFLAVNGWSDNRLPSHGVVPNNFKSSACMLGLEVWIWLVGGVSLLAFAWHFSKCFTSMQVTIAWNTIMQILPQYLNWSPICLFNPIQATKYQC